MLICMPLGFPSNIIYDIIQYAVPNKGNKVADESLIIQ